ncbi:MAG: lysophospholipid acyltransferase family protein [Spirochaetales bacterium]|nr:lysophospholipid acyltransferase family protein [Spirochaetales bacterium]
MKDTSRLFELDDSLSHRLTLHITQTIIWILAWPLFLVLYGLRIRGLSHLKNEKRGIIVGNHCQFIDAYYAGIANWPRLTWFAVESNNILRKDVGWLNWITGAFGIRDGYPMSIASSIPKAMKLNSFVTIFPEGRLKHRNQDILPFHKGAFYLAIQNDVPVVPYAQILHKRFLHRWFTHLFPRVTIQYLPVLYPADFGDETVPMKKRAELMCSKAAEMIQNCIDENGGSRELETDPLFS